MNCPKCQKPIPDGAAFCTECGENIEGIENNENSEKIEDAAASADEPSTEVSGAQTLPAEGNAGAAQISPVYGIPAADDVGGKPAEGGYVNTAAFAGKNAQPQPQPQVQAAPVKKKHSKAPVKPLSTWGFFWRTFLFMIPVLNIVLLFVFAFADGINENSRAYARSCLIYMLFAALMLIAGAVLIYIFADSVSAWLSRALSDIQAMIR